MLSSAAEGTVYRAANLTLDNVERLEVFDYAHDRLRKAVVRLNILNDLDLPMASRLVPMDSCSKRT